MRNKLLGGGAGFQTRTGIVNLGKAGESSRVRDFTTSGARAQEARQQAPLGEAATVHVHHKTSSLQKAKMQKRAQPVEQDSAESAWQKRWWYVLACREAHDEQSALEGRGRSDALLIPGDLLLSPTHSPAWRSRKTSNKQPSRRWGTKRRHTGDGAAAHVMSSMWEGGYHGEG